MSNQINPLLSISPLDGKYSTRLDNLDEITSEFGLIKKRIYVEVEWLIYLCSIKGVCETPPSDVARSELRSYADEFGLEDAERVKEIESKTNHDVKAAEVWLCEAMQSDSELAGYVELVHFGRTSDDINNLAYGLMLQEVADLWVSKLEPIITTLDKQAQEYADLSMLALTHGQPASPTTYGKELRVFAHRLGTFPEKVMSTEMSGKLNGATGNFAADVIAYPDVDWVAESAVFVESLGLQNNLITTQIEPHDAMAELFHTMVRANTVMSDLAKDMWGYISRGYLELEVKTGEVGSSTMPHKVNPIDFENAEGNLGLSNGVLEMMARSLPESRYQRDLSDSTVLRNIGVGFGYSLVAISSISKGLAKVKPNIGLMEADLDQNWSVLTEAVQTVMRKNGIAGAYDKVKDLSRGKQLDQAGYIAMVEAVDNLDEVDRETLLKLTPSAYIGLAPEIARYND